MKLSKYDNKLVQIKSIGETFEGYAIYDSIEYNECEFGRAEESLKILCVKIYKSEIDEIKVIDKYSGEFSDLEKEIILPDFDLVEEAVEVGEDIEIERLKKYFYKTIEGKKELNEEERKIKELFGE